MHIEVIKDTQKKLQNEIKKSKISSIKTEESHWYRERHKAECWRKSTEKITKKPNAPPARTNWNETLRWWWLEQGAGCGISTSECMKRGGYPLLSFASMTLILHSSAYWRSRIVLSYVQSRRRQLWVPVKCSIGNKQVWYSGKSFSVPNVSNNECLTGM